MTHRASPESRPTDRFAPLPAVTTADVRRVQSTIISWFDSEARDLPWRRPGTSAWGILVSEIMSQQTPVSRVAPRWREWMGRWPRPADLAQAPTAEVLHRWDRLGYPRRALRLQEAARVISDECDGEVPGTAEELERLPGVGPYTAAAVASFAHGQRTTVLDTNIRRVLIRLFAGLECPSPAPSRKETEWAASFVPETNHVAWNAGVMEFGALVCTARSPDCQACPLRDICVWNRLGQPASAARPKTQKWAGTNRQLRGAIMDVLKSAHETDGDGAVRVDLFTESVTVLSPELVDSLDPPVATALSQVRELSTDSDRISGLITDLVADGLAHRDGDRLSLPR